MNSEDSARLYLVTCDIRPGSSTVMDGLRTAHRQYIRRHAADIALGGLFGEDPHDPDGILLVIRSADAAAATAIARRDPYADVYDDVRVEQFHQRILGGKEVP